MIELYYQKSEDGGAYNPRENTDIFLMKMSSGLFRSVLVKHGEY